MASLLAIYHEKQFSSMCGQHCLNNLLQGPYFSAADLAAIAEELDNKERELMFSQGMDTPDALQYIADGSSNVDDSGNFSIQVLNTAVRRSHNLELVQDSTRLNQFLQQISQERSDSSAESNVEAFVLNLAAHWFAIRKLYGEFWEINSIEKTPKRISQFFLSAYLAQLQQEGWSVFLVFGELPQPLEDFTTMGQRSNWFVLGEDNTETESSELNASTAAGRRTQQAQSGIGDSQDYDDDLARAIALSKQLQTADGGAGANSESDDEETLLQQAIEMSMQPEDTAANPPTSAPLELSKVHVAMEPDPGDGVVRIRFMFHDGSSICRRFHESEPCGVLFSFLKESSESPLKQNPSATVDSITLLLPGSGSKISMKENCTSTLEEAGLQSSASLHVKLS